MQNKDKAYSNSNRTSGEVGEAFILERFASFAKHVKLNYPEGYVELDGLDIGNNEILEIKTKNVYDTRPSYDGHLYSLDYGKELLLKHIDLNKTKVRFIGVNVNPKDYSIRGWFEYDLSEGIYIPKGSRKLGFEMKNNVVWCTKPIESHLGFE